MIVIFHKNKKVVQIYDYIKNMELVVKENTIQKVLFSVAKSNKQQFIGWCHSNLKGEINSEKWNKIFKHPLIMASFEVSNTFYVNRTIGYVEDSPFIKVNKNGNYPTWLMSSDVGAIHASVVLKFEKLLAYKMDFDFFLNTIAKTGIKKGLLCYSNPNLLKNTTTKYSLEKNSISTLNLLWFIKSNYRFRWVILYVFHVFIYKKKFPFISFIKVLFKKPIHCDFSSENISIENTNKVEKPTIDVLIPTLGREKYLYNVLIDLSKQTLLPKKIIIIEQIPEEGAISKLTFLSNNWPFKIDHTLIHQLGVCNARNIALKKVTSNWVFFADDDVRFSNTLLENAFKYIHLYKCKAISLSCLQKGEVETSKFIRQSTTFGSGTSIVKSTNLKNCTFNMAYEFGYGEDADFGMQLRNTGTDILYIPFVSMLHLKAPIGGFRKKISKEWEKEAILPKPSPTIMVYKLKHATKEQLQSYKTTLFIKFFKKQKNKNPFSYYTKMKKAWEISIYWANQLITKNSNAV